MLRFSPYSVENNTNMRPDLDQCIREPLCAIYFGAPKSTLKYTPGLRCHSDYSLCCVFQTTFIFTIVALLLVAVANMILGAPPSRKHSDDRLYPGVP